MGRDCNWLIRSVRNSRFGPPVSIPSSKEPASSLNFTSKSDFSEKLDRLNPLNAPSQTFERVILNLLTVLWSMASANSAMTMAADIPVSL